MDSQRVDARGAVVIKWGLGQHHSCRRHDLECITNVSFDDFVNDTGVGGVWFVTIGRMNWPWLDRYLCFCVESFGDDRVVALDVKLGSLIVYVHYSNYDLNLQHVVVGVVSDNNVEGVQRILCFIVEIRDIALQQLFG